MSTENGKAYDPWKVVETAFSVETMAQMESIFALANGYIGLRGSFEEGLFSWNNGVYLNGFYEERLIMYGEKAYGFPEHGQTMLNVADASRIVFRIDGETLNLLEGNLSGYRRELDLREGVLRRSFNWTSPKGHTLSFSFERLVSLVRRRVMALKMQVRLEEGEAEVEILSSLDGTTINRTEGNDPRVGSTLHEGALAYVDKEAHENFLLIKGRTKTSALSFTAAAEHSIEGLKERRMEPLENIREIGLRFCGRMTAGEKLLVHKIAAYAHCPSAGEEKLREELKEDLRRAKEDGYLVLRAEQAGYLCEYWERADIEIGGDVSLQQGIRFNIFHLLQSVGKDGRTSIAAKGLTGEGYEGHFFWDTEIYVLPFFIYTYPAIARKLLEYRYHILPQARERAKELSQQGALYPWRTINGKEASAYYPAGTAQYHIDADIAYGVKKYLRATGDETFIAQAAEILIETARMWYDLGWFNERRGGAFCIDGVTGPDEYTALVNNNYYTNIMARDNLLFAEEMVRSYEEKDPQGFAELSKRLAFDREESRRWRRAAEAMCLPRDEELGIHSQDDSFLDKEGWPIESIPLEKRPLLLHYHPLVIYRRQVIKQADIVLALFLQGDKFAAAEKKRNFDYYDRITTGDSSLSACVQSIIASEIGYEELASTYFCRTDRIDLDDVNGNVRDGLHTAAMAGTWAAIVHGFAGMRDYDGILRFRPHLPRRWDRLSFSVCTAGCVVKVTMTHNEVAYALKEGEALEIIHRAVRHTVYAGSPLVFADRPELEAVIFDLDGVITDSAEYHYQAWKKLADELEIPFDREFNHQLRGVGRMDSLELILSRVPERSYSEEKKQELAAKKNEIYKDLITQISPDDLLPGIESLLKELKEAGIHIALASASRNAPAIMDNLQIGDLFEVMTDPGKVKKGKPDPEQFFMAAEMLGVPIRNCVGVEDAQAGVEAIRGAGMFCVGVGDYLEGADWKVSGTEELSLRALREQYYRSAQSRE